jgi:hypothetical protein
MIIALYPAEFFPAKSGRTGILNALSNLAIHPGFRLKQTTVSYPLQPSVPCKLFLHFD